MPELRCSPCPPQPQSQSRRTNCRSRRRRSTMLFASSSASTSSPRSSASDATTTASSSSRHDYSRGGTTSRRRRLRSVERKEGVEQREGTAMPEEGTDDVDALVAFARVPLHPFSLRLSGLCPSSPLLLAPRAASSATGPIGDPIGSAAMESFLEYISEVGARTFAESAAYGERFEKWDAGVVWSMVRVGGDDAGLAISRSGEVASSPSSSSNPPSTGVTRMRTRKRREPPPENVAILTLGRDATVTFRDVRRGDVPDPWELAARLVQFINSDGNRDGMLERVRPLACDAADSIVHEYEVKLEAMISNAVVTLGEENAQAVGNGAHDVITTEANELTGQSERPIDKTVNPDEIEATNPQDVTATENEAFLHNGILIDEATNAAIETNGKGDVTDPTTDLKNARTDYLEANPTLGGVAVDAIEDPTSQGSGPTLLPAHVAAISVAVIILAFLIASAIRHKRRKRRQSALQHVEGTVPRWSSSISSDSQTLDAPAITSAKSLFGGSWTPFEALADASTPAAVPVVSNRRRTDEILEDSSDDGLSGFFSAVTSDDELRRSGSYPIVDNVMATFGGASSSSPDFDGDGVFVLEQTRKRELCEETHRTSLADRQSDLKRDALQVACDAQDSSPEHGETLVEHAENRNISSEWKTSAIKRRGLAVQSILSPSIRSKLRKKNSTVSTAMYEDGNDDNNDDEQFFTPLERRFVGWSDSRNGESMVAFI